MRRALFALYRHRTAHPATCTSATCGQNRPFGDSIPAVELTRRQPAGGSNKFIGCRELADLLSLPERTVRDNWRRWGLTAYTVGRAIRFRERDVEAWLQRNVI